ncbi:MAG: hypothetical protein ACRD7E_31845 [Bryobacteraceae bacterium]
MPRFVTWILDGKEKAGRAALLAAAVTLLLSTPLCAENDGSAMRLPGDLTEASLEDLMSVEVSSANRKEQSVFRTAAAVFVITQDDI